MCPCDFDLWPTFPEFGHATVSLCWIHPPILVFNNICVFELRGHDNHDNHLCRTCRGFIVMLAPEYEIGFTTHNEVMAHFTCIHHAFVWLRPLTYLHRNWVRALEGVMNMCDYTEVCAHLHFLNIWSQTSEFVATLLGNRCCHGTNSVPQSSSCHLQSVILISAPSTELLQFTTWYVKWRCDLDLWPFDLGVISRDAFWWTTPAPSLI